MIERTPEAQRLYDAREAAAKELALEVGDWRVRRYAVQMVQYEKIEAQLATGRTLIPTSS